MLHLIWSVIVGFFVGLIARAILPGGDHIGIIATTAVGIVGSVIGGFIGGLIKKPEPGATFHPAGFVLSIISLRLARSLRGKHPNKSTGSGVGPLPSAILETCLYAENLRRSIDFHVGLFVIRSWNPTTAFVG